MSHTVPLRPLAPPQLSAATSATYVAFIGAGIMLSSWASRIPAVRDLLNLTSSQLGLVLLSAAVGSLLSLPLAGTIVHRLGTRFTVAVMAVVEGLGLGVVAIGSQVGVVAVVLGLFILGFANGAWDVAMNVQAAAVERHSGRSIMSRFHAGFSVGTVVGAGIGAAMVALGVSVLVHLVLVAALLAAAIPWSVRQFLPDADDRPADDRPADNRPADDRPAPGAAAGRGSVLSRWREPRTLLIGLLLLSFAFTEGAGNDWIAISLIDGHATSAVAGTLGFACFLAAMTSVRWFGPTLLDSYGRVPVLRVLAVVATAGVLLFSLAPPPWLAFMGAIMWGAGASLGFPVAMSAAADDPAAAPGRVSVVASLGYCAFLAGPPLVGFLGEHVTVLRALLVVSVLLLATLPLTSVVTPLPEADQHPADN